jgi:hypothetical protein
MLGNLERIVGEGWIQFVVLLDEDWRDHGLADGMQFWG